ncbi:MAG: guanylate kinase [Endomicrobium sp.]|nr:guanylate kinase [Endomicrobium sp.]
MSKKISNFIKKTGKVGNIIIISAPSGSGKSSICEAVLAEGKKNINYSISYTTRPPRKDEKNGKNYYFISENKFKQMVEEKKFVEWAKVHGSYYYGTSKELLNKALSAGKNIILEIDVQGGVNIKKQYPNNSCMIFIMAPDFKTLKKRLTTRNKDCKETIYMRMLNAKKELKYLPKYEYLVINKKLDEAVYAVKTIIKSLEYKIEKDRVYFV